MLSAEQARSLILIVHELLTNAVKYGALSNSAGQLRIEWSREDHESIIRWQEIGVPLLSEPERKGFGTTLVEHCVTSVRGSWERSFESEGLQCRIVFPL
jgi:two-component sensor histidine kinase